MHLGAQGLNFFGGHCVDRPAGDLLKGCRDAVAEDELRQIIDRHRLGGVFQIVGDKRPKPGIS